MEKSGYQSIRNELEKTSKEIDSIFYNYTCIDTIGIFPKLIELKVIILSKLLYMEENDLK